MLIAVPLRTDVKSPWLPESDEEEWKSEKKEQEDEKTENGEDEESVEDDAKAEDDAGEEDEGEAASKMPKPLPTMVFPASGRGRSAVESSRRVSPSR